MPRERPTHIPTGGRPEKALAAAALKWADPAHVVRLTVSHDDGCPCLAGRPMSACTCEVVGLEAERLA